MYAHHYLSARQLRREDERVQGRLVNEYNLRLVLRTSPLNQGSGFVIGINMRGNGVFTLFPARKNTIFFSEFPPPSPEKYTLFNDRREGAVG